MNQITLNRKGGLPPWVFERFDIEQGFRHRTKYGGIYEISFDIDSDDQKIIIAQIENLRYDGIYWADATKKIRADHFTLGNVTITF